MTTPSDPARSQEHNRGLAGNVLFTNEMEAHATLGDPCTAVPAQNSVLEMNELLSQRLPYFHRCALRLLGNAADAEDAVQEALLSAYRHIDQFKGQSQMTTWLTTIVRNCAPMQLRRRRRQNLLSLDEPIEEMRPLFLWEILSDVRPSPEDECRSSELTVRLRKCTALLSPPLRRTFELRVMNGLSICETAQVLGVPRGTVKAQLARARKSIARHIKPRLGARSRGALHLR